LLFSCKRQQLKDKQERRKRKKKKGKNTMERILVLSMEVGMGGRESFRPIQVSTTTIIPW
jgi:hypothetical protein